tara:strand:- start:303 stop:995 length:693 start_codon:yes stop_codon:yes gene_type:complete
MKLKNLLPGVFIKRYKRFFVDILLKSKKITVHCPNSGSMLGLLNKGNNVWISKSDNLKRKLKYTLEIIQVNKSMIGINTFNTNKIVFEALSNRKIKELSKYDKIESEKRFGSNSRFDFLLNNKKEKCLLEVKNVTLSRKRNVAEFPDAITTRGKKHLEELIKAKSEGYESFMLFVIQRNDCNSFKISNDIDPEYYATLNKAKKYGVKMLCYDCKINNKEVILNKKINFLQ